MFVYRGYMSTAWVTFWGRCFLPMRHHTCFLILAIGCPQASRPYGNVPNLSHHFRLAGEIPFGTKKLSVKVIYIYIIYQYWVNIIPPILIFSHLDLLKASWLIICLSNHANMLFWDILSLWKVKCSPKMAKDMNCKTNNHRHILSQIYAHHIQAFVGYNIRIWAVYPCTSVYLYGTKFLFACFARQPHVRCCQTAMSGWWLSHPSDKYESQWEGWHPIHILWKIIRSCLKPPTRVVKTARHLKSISFV